MRKKVEANSKVSLEVSSRPKGIGLGAMLGLLLIFSVVVALVSFSVRNDIRRQLLDVDSHVLSLLVHNEILKSEREAGFVFEFETLSNEQIWEALLETTSLEGVFAVQFFELSGELAQSSSSSLVDQFLPDVVNGPLGEGRSYSVFSSEVWLSEFVELDFRSDRQVAVLDIYIPLMSGDDSARLGTARYLMDGSVLAGEFAVLDTRMARQASVAIGLGGVAILSLFWVAWRRLTEVNARVVGQAERLKKVNAELAMLARTSAVGSVTAHLIHGLKNPLAGLRQVVSARQTGEAAVGEDEWKGASQAAERMQRMVEEVISVLQDASTGLSYEVQSGEFLRELESRFEEEAEERDIAFSVSGEGGVELDSGVSSIALLVATNLLKNAFEAVGESGRIRALISFENDFVVLRVEDNGRGVPDELKNRLFAPVTSGKSGGAGIGLAISAQLARHLGGSIQLVDTLEKGAVFEFRFPTREAKEGRE
ncbi:ATPase, histidine kinase-, DNA gyrase B-, and HSP90-like domain protein [Verrucomicrobiia bacterium DG1235]|nr:ATPase, histidine kinase-, DNA gyrase B-, and HSP90-like domain protein [Verrucomicrobiae bacterium DG1235]